MRGLYSGLRFLCVVGSRLREPRSRGRACWGSGRFPRGTCANEGEGIFFPEKIIFLFFFVRSGERLKGE